MNMYLSYCMMPECSVAEKDRSYLSLILSNKKTPFEKEVFKLAIDLFLQTHKDNPLIKYDIELFDALLNK